ncbi:caspase family protein [Streptomyces sp. NPDC026092]|uniref:caspase family protein n=1 Tax=Streptomyces sp. NPDC026092 TaxID=3154797 RepID=UPI0033EBEE3C
MTTASFPVGRSTDLTRVALVSGTSTFRDGFEPLPRVPDELRMMRAVLAEAGFTIHHDSQTDPKVPELKESFEKALDGVDGTPPDILLFYYSGHGIDIGNRDVLLAAHDSVKAEPHTMLDVAALMSSIIPGIDQKPRPREVVVLFDACRSGLAIHRLGEEARKQHGKSAAMPVLTLISSTDQTTDAQQMHFADSFTAALRNTRAGHDEEHLDTYKLFAELEVRMRKGSVNPKEPQLPDWVPPREGIRAFPNPRYNPRRRVRRPPEANDTSGWAFCGRAEAVRDLLRHLEEETPSDPGAPLVLTGRPGSGKSVLLDWIHASSSDEPPLPAGARAPAPAPRGSVDHLLDVRGKSVDAVVGELARRCRTDEEDSAGLVEALGDRGLRLVFDSVDASEEPELLYRTLLAPLAAQPRTRVVLATSEVPDGFDGPLIDLDADAYFHEADVVALVEHVLRNRKDTRWSTTDTGSIRDIALATSAAAGRSWLRAYLFAVDTSAQDPATAKVEAERSNADLFLEALARLSRELDDDDPQWARDMLLPVALAGGDGLPADGRLWAAVVRAAGKPGAGPADIIDVCREARDYLDVPEDGMNGHGWRLTRPPTADYLADSDDNTHRYHGLFVAAMIEELPLLPSGQRDWSSADQYTREHLPYHARLAGILEQYLDDPEFLLAMHGETLYRTLGLIQKTTDDRVANVRALCWELMGARWRPDGHTLARLALHAQVRALDELARRSREYASGWQAVAVDCRPPELRPQPKSKMKTNDRDVPADRGVKSVHCLPDGGELALTGHRVFHRPAGADDTAWAVLNPDPEKVHSRREKVPPRITASSVSDHDGQPMLIAGDIKGAAWLTLLNGTAQEIEGLDLHCQLNTCLKVGQDLLIVGSEGWHWRSPGVTRDRVDKPGLRLGGATAALTSDGVRVAARTASQVVVWRGDGERLHTFEPPQKRGLKKITSNAHGIYTGAGDGSVWWSDWQGRSHRWIADHASGISDLRLCTVGATQVLVSAGVRGDIRLSPATGSGTVHHFDIGLEVHSVDVHDNGQILVGTVEGLVRITP